MKSLSILFLLSFLMIGAQAQKIRFSDHRNRWVAKGERTAESCPYVSFMRYSPVDSVIHGQAYQGFVDREYAPYVVMGCSFAPFTDSNQLWIREDTGAGMVYYRNTSTDTLEHVLYNYNLMPGDTIVVQSGITDSLVSLDSVIIDGVWHKVFNFKLKTGMGRQYNVIEGIGCTSGPFYPAVAWHCFETTEKLICFSQDSIYPSVSVPWISCFSSSSSAIFVNSGGCAALDVSDAKTYSNTITISPNPAIDLIHIAADEPPGGSMSVAIYDLTGRCVYRLIDTQLKDLNINSTLWHGLYLVIVQNSSGVLKMEKVLVGL